MHPLDGPRLKIVRAKSEIDRLGLMEDAFRENTKHHVVRAEFNPKSGKNVYRISIDGSPPSPEWGVYIGEIAHNFRSALDNLVYQLALLHDPETVAGPKGRRLQFPIFVVRDGPDKNGTFEGQKKRMIGLLRPEHQARIERLQPYKRGSGVPFKPTNLPKRGRRNGPLFWLQEINNADKHRLFQVVASRTGIGLVIDRGGDSPNRSFTKLRYIILKDGAKFGEAPPDMHVDTKISPVIAFGHSCKAVAPMGVCYVLELIATYVSEIVESFAPEF